MSLAVMFTVVGKAVGKGRPRVSTIAGRPRLYTPATTVAWEQLVADAARSAMGSQSPVEGPVSVRIAIDVQIPQSWSKARRKAAEDKQVHPGKPDLDNVAKAVLDALNGICYQDDKQVVRLVVVKRYGVEPMIEVFMHEVLD